MKRMSVFGIMLMLLIMGMLTSVFDIQSVKAQEDFTVTIGQNKVFTEFNYYDAWFEDDPNNPLPWPEDRSAEDGENWAFVSLGAAAGQAGVAQAQKGLQFEWNLEPYTWEDARNLPVRVTVDFSYNLESYYEEDRGSANAFLGFNLERELSIGSWYEGVNNETIGGGAVEAYSTTVGGLEAMDRQLLFIIYAQAHATSIATGTHYSSSLVTINSITIEFDLKTTDFTVTIGQDKVFSEFNYYDAWFENDPNNPPPWPEDRDIDGWKNWAFVSLGAAAGQAGVAQAQKGLQFEWNLEPYTWEGAKDLPVRIIVDFSYNLEAYYEEGFGSANAFLGFNLAQHLGFGSWYDGANNETIGGNSVETYSTTVGELEAMDRQLLFTVYAQAHATSDATKTHYSSSLVNINSIAIEFDFKITDFGISLGYHVEPNGEETYSQEVKATVFHSQGADIIASFVAIAPDGHQLPVTSENIGSNSLSSVWFEGGLTDPPPLGVYTIQALYKDGDVARVARVVSWPTDHVSDSVPTITEPANHEVVWTANPTFSWEPFSGATTGYLVEVSGPPEVTLPGDDVVWRIALHPTQTHVQFNSDGTAAVPELPPGNTYRLTVLAFEDIHSGIQSYRDTSIRCIEFSVESFEITDFGVSLGYYVGPNGEETYSQGVQATVFHSQGTDKIQSFVAIDPNGQELPIFSENIGSDYWRVTWDEWGLTDPPTFGAYTIEATDKNGRTARVVSWPTDHVSDSVPTITEPANHEVVWTANPTFSWEPFSGATTGYLVEVSGPPEETLPDDDVVWRIALHPTQTHVQFNSDGTAAVPQLTLGGDYRLMVLAFEDIHSGIQSYRDTSIRCIEFSVCSAEMYSPILRFDSREVWFPTACYTRMVSTQNWNIYEFWYRYEFNDLWNVGEALSGGMNPYELPDIVRCMKISDIEDLREKYNHVDDLEIAWIFVNKATGEVEKVRTTVHSWIHSAPIQYWTFDGEHVILYVELGDHGMEHKQWFAAEGQVTQPSLDCIDLEYWFMTGEHNSLNPVVIRDRVNNYRYPDYEGIENAPQTSAQDLHYRMASIHSPASLSVSDSLGRVTGLVDGEEKNEIPFSEYKDGIILIRSPTEPLSWTVKGTGDGTYGLDIVDSDQEGIIFEATDIPITEGATHTYSVDWDVLAQGEAGVTVQVDSDGDGVAEHTFASDSELTQSEYASATGEDGTPPETELNIGEPKIVVNDRTYVTSTAPIALMAEDDSGGSGVASTAYKIYSSAYDSGWITYTEPFYLIGLSDGVYNINYNSTDYVGNVESTNSIQVTLFSWKYTFEDSYGRGTILKINTEHKFFNFKTPDGDYGIIKAMYMQVRRSTIVIFHRDNELTLTTLGIDSRLDFCVAYAKDRQTRKTYWIIDRLGKR